MRTEEILEVAATGKKYSRRLTRAMSSRGRHAVHTGRAPGKTGQPEWFVEMQEKMQAKKVKAAIDRHSRKYLSKIPTAALVEYCGTPEKVAKSIATLYPTVWALSQGNTNALLALPDVGPASLRKLRQALVLKRVEVLWGAP